MEPIGLAASYRRRALYTTLGAALVGACILGSTRHLAAQGSPPPAVPGASNPTAPAAPQTKPTTKKKPATATLKVVPIPRTRAADPQADGAANPQTGGGAGTAQPGGGANRRQRG